MPRQFISFSRPKDKSLEAYKAWMTGLFDLFILPANRTQISEEEWVMHWKKFWKEPAPPEDPPGTTTNNDPTGSS